MKLNVRLIYTYDNNYGEFGWKVKKIKSFGISSAEGLVHDILEHHPRDKGTYVEEISAYGAMLAYRGNSDWLIPKVKTQLGKARESGIILSGDILENMHERKPNTIGKIFPTKVFKPDNELIMYFAISANNEFGAIELVNWIYQWAMSGYTRANKIIETCGWDGPYIYEETFRTIEANLFFTENWFEGAEVSVQVDFSRCSTEVIPINCKRMFN